jgi:hypothetical protein
VPLKWYVFILCLNLVNQLISLKNCGATNTVLLNVYWWGNSVKFGSGIMWMEQLYVGIHAIKPSMS